MGRISSSPEHYNQRPVILWFANGNFPVKENAKLELSADGNLSLTDVDDSQVWSTETSGNKVTHDFGWQWKLEALRC